MKHTLLFLLSLSVWAVAPVITPGTTTCTPTVPGAIPCVAIATTMTFTANQSVTWSLISGSTGSINSSSGLYTAPASITAHNNLLGVQNKPNDHIFNTDIHLAPVDATLTAYMNSHVNITTKIALLTDYPYNHVNNSSTTYPVVFKYTGSIDGSFAFPDFAHIGADAGVYAPLDTDNHLITVNTDTGEVAEFYKLFPVGTTLFSICTMCSSVSGVSYYGNYEPPNTAATTAAGTEISPLNIRYSEIRNCIDNGVPIKHGSTTTYAIGWLSNTFVWPATLAVNDVGMLPFGSRVRLKASFDETGFSVGGKCLLEALKNYGVFAVDGGADMQVGVFADTATDWDTWQSMVEVNGNGPRVIRQTDMEVIDESMLEDLDATSPGYQSHRVDPLNGVVTPDDFVTVKACNSTPECSTMPVIIQGVTIGTEQTVGYSFMAGAPSHQIPYWVNGSTNTAVTFSMSPSLGTLTSGGLYTPPSTSSTRQETVVTITSSADTNQTLHFPLYIYPQGGIRERFSNDINTNYGPDVSGNTWFISKGMMYRFTGSSSCDWRPYSVTWAGTSDGGLYNVCGLDGNPADHYYRFIVPNGTYTVKMLYGIPTGQFPTGYWLEGADTQGSLYSGSSAADPMTQSVYAFLGLSAETFDLCNVAPGSCPGSTALSITLPTATVTDNNLYAAVRGVYHNPLTAIEITPSGAPTAPTITTSCPMPGGTTGTPYSQTLTASGTSPFTWSIASGGLPGGLTLSSGIISGTPTGTGSSTFGIGVTNSVGAGTNSPLSCSITITAAAGGSIKPGRRVGKGRITTH